MFNQPIKNKPTLLLVTYVSTNNLRDIQRNLINCYNDYIKDFNVFTVNLLYSNILSLCCRYKWDIIIYHSSLSSLRFNRNRYLKLLNKNHLFFLKLKTKCQYQALFVQDEFLSMDLVCKFINKYSINTVFSVAPKTEIKKIYKTVNFKKTKFYNVLTGYIDKKIVEYIKKKKRKKRPFLIGYRAHAEIGWGTFNLKKIEIGKLFKDYCLRKNLPTSIKFGAKNFFLGYEWYNFLLNCKATIGIEGGSNILDWDGNHSQRLKYNQVSKLKKKELLLLEKNLTKINLKALSPKHLEACITKTCQILVKGRYNSILKPWLHYIPLKNDHSNIEQVMKLVTNKKIRRKITETAYKDIVESNKYTYEEFVRYVLSKFNVKPYLLESNNLKITLVLRYKLHQLRSKFLIFFLDLIRKFI